VASKLLKVVTVQKMLGENTTSEWLLRGMETLKPLAYFAVYTVADQQRAKDNK